LLAALAVVLVLTPAGVARAHIDVDEYQPETGELLAETPAKVTIRFSTDPNPSAIEITLQHRNGTLVPFTGEGPAYDGRTVTLIPPALDYGTYVVVWRSVGSDGHIAAGQSHFSVGQPDVGPIGDLTAKAGLLPTVIDAVTRLGVYVLLGFWLGAVWLRRRLLVRDDQVVERAGRLLALGLLASIVVRFLVVAERAGANQGLLYGISRAVTTMPNALGWAALLLGALGAMALRRNPLGLTISLVVVAAGETLTGHMATANLAGLLVPLTVLHLLGAAFWVGGIVAFLALGRRSQAHTFVRSFSLTGSVAVAVVGLTGVLLTVVRTRGGDISSLLDFLRYRYGQVLTLKWAVIALWVAPVAIYHALFDVWPRLRSVFADDAESSSADDAEVSIPPSTEPERSRGTRLRRGFLVEAVGLAVVLGFGSSLAGLSPVPDRTTASVTVGMDLLAAPETFQECMDPTSSTDQLLCVNRYFEGVVAKKGMNAALLEVSSRWREGDPWMLSNCHSIGHRLGRLGFKLYGSITKAFEAGSDPCDYGYLHGVIEGASADFTDADLLRAMTTLCEGTGDATNHGYRQCIHGLGHAAARRVNNDLARGMEFCRAFYTPGNPQPGRETTEELIFNLCVTGVSMEWNTQRKALAAMTLPIGADDTLLGECLKIDKIFHTGCIEYGTSAMGGLPEREIAARDWCDKNLAEPLPCYQSIGRDVIWSDHISDELAMEICTGGRGGIYAEECITRALGSVATIALDAYAIDEFCPVVPAQYRHLCAMVRDAMIVQIEQTLSGFIIEPKTAS